MFRRFLSQSGDSPLTRFSIDHPRLVLLLTILVTAAFLFQFPRVRIDTDPKNMLPVTSDVRVYNDRVEKMFALHKDVLVLGIVNEDGIFQRGTLERMARLTSEIVQLKGVVGRDVAGFTTVDNVVAEGNTLGVHPLLTGIPKTPEALAAFRRSVLENPLFVDRLVAKDGTTAAIYIPLEEGANGKWVADRLRELVARESGPERTYIAGDPVARDTFGSEMFKQMGLFSPMAGGIMFLALLLMFRSLSLVMAMMGVAMISIIWSMGALIGFGFTVHIMSSMIPVFLMAISTDSVHIFNEFYFRYKEVKDKRQAILDTMRVVGPPVRYTALATAVGFGVLVGGSIVPVQVFGLFVAFGTLVIRLMSFSFLPAVMILLSEERLARFSVREDMAENRTVRWLSRLGEFSLQRRTSVLAAGLAILLLAVGGMALIRINNNMVRWFRPNSEIRQADRLLNERLGGTATAYLVAEAADDDAMKRPEVLHYLEGMQRELERSPVVGKTVSLVDIVKRIHRIMNQDRPTFEVVPDSQAVIAQYLFLFGMAAKPSALNNAVDYPFRRANIQLQLKTWDATAMNDVMERVRAFTALHAPPGLTFKPAGIAYFNKVWNDTVLYDMLYMFILASVVVLGILAWSFRSLVWGAVAILPLLFAIAIVYGFVGFIGKDFDMPISVLSTLSLGMAVDFAIHFGRRFQQRYGETGDLPGSLVWTVARPGKGILRNALLFSLAFSVMALASLTPYITVGLFIIGIMMLSAFTALLYLPPLLSLFWPFLAEKPTSVRPPMLEEKIT